MDMIAGKPIVVNTFSLALTKRTACCINTSTTVVTYKCLPLAALQNSMKNLVTCGNYYAWLLHIYCQEVFCMEALLSVICALGGLVLGLMFLWDLSLISSSGGTGRRGWVRLVIKLVVALLLLHFHFELDIFD